MRDARRFDEQVTIGSVPSIEDLRQLKELGYDLLVDVREEHERFGGLVGDRARELGLGYVALPIARDAIEMEQVLTFYDVVYRDRNARIYAFSRYGKKPLTFLLLFYAAAHDESAVKIFRHASQFGLSLVGDLTLQDFVVRLVNAGELGPIREAVQRLRPELLEGSDAGENEAPSSDPAWEVRVDVDEIAVRLDEAAEGWAATGDASTLRERLDAVLALLDER